MSDDKASIRADALRRRARARAADPLAGETAAALFPAAALTPGATVAAYAPLPSEIDPTPLALRLAALGARLCLPVAEARDAPLTFRLWTPGDPLIRGVFGTREPSPAAAEVEPDLVLVPLAAFDRAGRRLGLGAGFYDRTLARLRAFKPVTAVGLAYAVQEVETVPVEPHDQPLDAVLTERAYMPVRKDRP